MSLNTSNKIFDLSSRSISSSPLKDKGVLIIGKDTATVRHLVYRFAQRGADVALLCQNFSDEDVWQMKKNVHAYGQHLNFLDPQDDKPNMQLVMEEAKGKLGRLDLFVDLTAQQINAGVSSDSTTAYASNWHINGKVADEFA